MSDYYRFTITQRNNGITAHCRDNTKSKVKRPYCKYTTEYFEEKTQEDLWKAIQQSCNVNRKFMRRGKWVVTTVDKLDDPENSTKKPFTVQV